MISKKARNRKKVISFLMLLVTLIKPGSLTHFQIKIIRQLVLIASYRRSSVNNTIFEKIKLDPQIELSPRLALSHPITETSKLYFNYGHYLQMPIAQDLYRVRRGFSEEVLTIGDPNLPMANTIAYEIGFDQSFL